MLIQSFVFPHLAIQSYLVADEATKKCAVIDAPRIIDPIREYIQSHDFTLEAILETHVHADFVSGAVELKEAFGGKPTIYCSGAGGKEWVPTYADKTVNDGESLMVGAIMLKALHTPGHTPEHLSWLCYGSNEASMEPICLFTGDFLFVRGVGRPDLLGQSMQETLLQELHRSLFTRLEPLSDNIKVFPSHGAGSMCGKSIGASPSSTLGEERRENPAFKQAEMEQWKSALQLHVPAAPKTFARNKKINLNGAPLLQALPPALEVKDKQEVLSYLADGWVLDFREPEAFAHGHLKGSVNVPTSPSVGNWLAGILPEEAPLLCVLSTKGERDHIQAIIRTLGYDQPLAFLEWGQISDLAEMVTTLEVLHSHDLNTMLHGPNNLFILDVRTPLEWDQGHLHDATHIELNAVEKSLESIPKDKPILVICGSGWRSSIAASLLKKKGYKKVSHLWGGMKAWEAMTLSRSS